MRGVCNADTKQDEKLEYKCFREILIAEKPLDIF